LRELRQRHIRFSRTANRFVIDVGKIHHAMNFVSAQFQMPLQQIFEKVGAEISDMRETVNRRPAGVHLDRARGFIERMEFLQLARVSIEKAQRHPRR
jgi:hypothetical protein